MLELLLLFGVIFLILTFFYKQAICEFRINQLEWSQRDNVSSLLREKVPLVLRSIPSASFWTHEDLIRRECFQNIPVFQQTSLVEWIRLANPQSVCPWKYPQAETVAAASGMAIWAKKWFHPIIMNPFLKLWMTPRYHCWAGNVGLRKTFATWTCLFPVDGAILVSIMTEAVESSLPNPWTGCFPSQLTTKDTPFVADVKYIDIVLRPGSCLFMPAHWFVSWTSTKESNVIPMVCTISYHTPISLLAFKASPYT